MSISKYEKMSQDFTAEGRKPEAPPEIEAEIRDTLMSEYAHTAKKYSDIVKELADRYPKYNIIEIVRAELDHSRE